MSAFREKLKRAGDGFWPGVGMLLLGLFMTGTGGGSIRLNLRSKGWPTVQGTVTESGMSYVIQVPTFELPYRYVVAGPSYQGWTEEVSDEVVDGRFRYRSGARVVVHHDPEDPHKSALAPSFHPTQLVTALAGTAFVGVGPWSTWEALFGWFGLWPGVGRRLR